jgi:hypothetical protein
MMQKKGGGRPSSYWSPLTLYRHAMLVLDFEYQLARHMNVVWHFSGIIRNCSDAVDRVLRMNFIVASRLFIRA